MSGGNHHVGAPLAITWFLAGDCGNCIVNARHRSLTKTVRATLITTGTEKDHQ
jgi:hypothetical protein